MKMRRLILLPVLLVSSGIVFFEEKSSLYNSVAATGQSGSLNEIDERSGSGCYHKVLRNISLKRFAFTFFVTFIFLMNFTLLITFLTNSSFLNTFNFLIRFAFPITSYNSS